MYKGSNHKLQRTNYNSPVIAIMANKEITIKAIATTPKRRTRKKRFGIFTKKSEE